MRRGEAGELALYWIWQSLEFVADAGLRDGNVPPPVFRQSGNVKGSDDARERGRQSGFFVHAVMFGNQQLGQSRK